MGIRTESQMTKDAFNKLSRLHCTRVNRKIEKHMTLYPDCSCDGKDLLDRIRHELAAEQINEIKKQVDLWIFASADDPDTSDYQTLHKCFADTFVKIELCKYNAAEMLENEPDKATQH